MIKWLLRQWHRLTLGSTARVISGPFSTASAPGTLLALVYEIDQACTRSLPATVYFEICERRATDLNQPSTIRIVIETRH